MEVGNNMANVSASIYKPPLLEFGGRTTKYPLDRDGKGGNVDIKRTNFFKPAKIGKWLIINTSRARPNELEPLAGALRDVGTKFGMEFGKVDLTQE